MKESEFNKNVLDLFNNLTENTADKRIKASSDILQFLHKKQANESEVCADVQYSLERLVKGLGSLRNSARLGFPLLLTQLIKHLNVVDIEDVLKLVKDHIISNSNLEKREIVFGQLFAYTAIIRSGRLANDSNLQNVVTSLFNLFQGKSYIVKASYEIMSDLFSQLSTEKFKDAVWPCLKEKFASGWENSTADSLWPLLLTFRMFPECTSKFLKKHFDASDLLSKTNWDKLKKIHHLTTSSLPSLHPFCIEFINIILPRKNFKDIWIHVIDDDSFDNNQGYKKAFVGLEMAKKILLCKPKKEIVKHALSPKLCAIFLKSLFLPQHPMNAAAKSFASFLCEFAKSSSDAEVQLAVLEALLEPSCETEKCLQLLFKTTEFTSIVQNLQPEAIKGFCDFLKRIVIKRKSKESDHTIQTYTLPVIRQIVSLVAHANIARDIEWRLDVVKFLFLCAFFHVKNPTDLMHCDKEMEEKDPSLLAAFKDSFFKALTSLHHRSQDYHPTHEQYLKQLMSIVEYGDQIMSAGEAIVPHFPLDKVQGPWKKLKSMIHRMEKQDKDGKTKESNAFKLLLLKLVFHLLHETDLVLGLVDELEICCKEALHSRKSPETEPSDESKPPWICVLTDILLSVVSRPDTALQSTAIAVFPHFCPFFTEDALKQILAVINPEADDTEPMLVDDDEEEEAEFDSGSSDESEIEESNNTSAADDKFRNQLLEALGAAADDSDAESVALSDSEMFKLDEAISKVFKSRLKSGHTQLGEEDQAMLNFRLKCLDLIALYLKSEPQMNLVLACIEPLLAAHEFGHTSKHQEPLLRKSLSTLKTLRKVKEFKDIELSSKSKVKELLTNLIERCHKETNLLFTDKLYSICVFLVLCYRRLEAVQSPEKKSKKSACVKLYLSALEKFMKDSNITANFFVSFMQACPDLAWSFIQPCSDYALKQKELRMHKRSLCLGILIEALKFSKNQSPISTDEWMEMGTLLTSTVVQELKEILETKSEIKPIYFNDLLEILLVCYTIVQSKVKQSLLAPHSDLLPLLCAMEDKQVKKLQHLGQAKRRKLIVALGGTIPVTQKKTIKAPTSAAIENGVENNLKRPLSTEEGSDDEDDSPKKKKKKKSKKQKIVNGVEKDLKMQRLSTEVEDDSPKKKKKSKKEKIVNAVEKDLKRQRLSTEVKDDSQKKKKKSKKQKTEDSKKNRVESAGVSNVEDDSPNKKKKSKKQKTEDSKENHVESESVDASHVKVKSPKKKRKNKKKDSKENDDESIDV